ncbi:UbiD family decarboxylase [Streptomyces sp. LBL]|uniref:UbiD family decarboxylase n=1 Tax=Streptomyces sp. LBL TaxID=2940562 RepID=UPI00247557F1|nr:UbiD family decarboxylase [Streptomyces sp. LBL]MDH6630308.1 UbiD family decarboxylase [Streptomyces sp. LBL]
MTYLKDLREYMDALDKLGDLRVIDREVDPHLEVGAVIRRVYETKAPAPLFNNLKGSEPGYRLFGAPGGLSSAPGQPLARIALSIGLDADADARKIVETLAEARTRKPIEPVLVETGPVKQNILLGDDASLDRFPTPLLHDGDGGPYVNTWGTIVARTPDGKFTNWSIARIMMIDEKTMTGLVLPGQHINHVWQQWVDIGQPMPFALVQGGPPVLPIVSGMPLATGVEEGGYIGGLLGEPIELVQCETVDLQVPATAEIVIEGHLSIERTAVEGPMGEFAGYVPSHTTMCPVYSIEAITHRDDPIWPTCVEGEPVDEFHTVTGLAAAAEGLAALRAAGLPVTTAWMPFDAATHLLVVSVAPDWRKQLPGVSTGELTQRIHDVIYAQRFTVTVPRLVVLDDDVDTSNVAELMWALATRVHPTKRRILQTAPILPLLACYTLEERHAASAEHVTYDALFPAIDEGREPRASFRYNYPAEIQERVIAHWND